MAVTEASVPVPAPIEHPEAVGRVGRLGRWAADHVRAVSIAWAVIAVALAVFAPKVETALPRWLDRLLPDVRFGHS